VPPVLELTSFVLITVVGRIVDLEIIITEGADDRFRFGAGTAGTLRFLKIRANLKYYRIKLLKITMVRVLVVPHLLFGCRNKPFFFFVLQNACTSNIHRATTYRFS